ncbi:MAG: hypothetical protein WA213_15605 [Terriglobales bacterium]
MNREAMKHIQTIAVAGAVVLAVVALSMLSANAVLVETDGQASFHQLAGLEGRWVGKGSQGQLVEVTFRMTAGGSALMSEIHGEGHEDMITMFHMDGDRLIMTHYCGAGNQPRMKVVSADAKSVSFEFFDGTNIAPGTGHMQFVTFAQPDANHHTEEWVFLNHGKEMKESFTLERAK